MRSIAASKKGARSRAAMKAARSRRDEQFEDVPSVYRDRDYGDAHIVLHGDTYPVDETGRKPDDDGGGPSALPVRD